MVFPADDVRDVHVMIVNNHSKIVSGNSVRAHYDEITDRAAIKSHRTANYIIEGDLATIDFEAKGWFSATGCKSCPVRFCEFAALSSIPRRHTSLQEIGPFSL